MPITTMVSADKKDQPNVVVIRDYWGNEEGRVQHHASCPHKADETAQFERRPECTTFCYTLTALYMETTHVGEVLATGEHNFHDDSDFYAIVWDDEKNAPVEIEYASTRGWSYPNHAEVDATPEVLSKFAAWKAERKREADELERHVVRVGRRVRIIKGKKHKDKEGIVTWQGVNPFRAYYRNGYNRPEHAYNQRIRVQPDEGEAFFTEYLYAEVIL